MEEVNNTQVAKRLRKRTTANIVGIIIFSLIGIIGTFLIFLGATGIASDLSGPESSAKGLAAAILWLFLVAVTPITVISLFFAAILALNLKLPVDIYEVTALERDAYAKKTMIVGIITLVIGCGAGLAFLFYRDPLGTDTMSQVVSVLASIGAIPLAILCVIWGVVYLVRAARVSRFDVVVVRK